MGRASGSGGGGPSASRVGRTWLPSAGTGGGGSSADALRFLAFRQSRIQGAGERGDAEARRRLVEGPMLVLPVMGKFEFGFNPNDLVPLDDQRTVYPWLRVSDDRGGAGGQRGMLVREAGAVTRVVVPATPRAPRSPGRPGSWT